MNPCVALQPLLEACQEKNSNFTISHLREPSPGLHARCLSRGLVRSPAAFQRREPLSKHDRRPDAQPEPHKAITLRFPYSKRTRLLKREEGEDRPPGLTPDGNLAS